jgi:hypothetical protein
MMTSLKLYRGVWPQNVSRLAKFGVRSHDKAWRVCVLYDVGSGLRYLALDKDRDDVAAMVNEVKTAFGHTPGGTFYVNEYRHVIVPVDSGEGPFYYYAGHLTGNLMFQFEGASLSTFPAQPDGTPLAHGDRWVGPRPGIPYVLAAGGNDIHYTTPALTETDPPVVRPMMTMQVKLSKVLRNEALVRRVVEPIVRIKGFQGGRFYVNEHGAAFTPIDKNDGNGIDYIYCGTVDRSAWFPEPRTT